MADEIKVLLNPAAGRFEATVDGHLSVCEYELAAGTMTFTHTAVPTELRGRGIAELLVRAALAEARRAGHRVVPRCSYVAKFTERHAEYHDLLDTHRPEAPRAGERPAQPDDPAGTQKTRSGEAAGRERDGGIRPSGPDRP